MYLIDDTEASLIIDDFSKSKSIQITKVAGNTINLFVDTFEFTERECFIDSLKKISFQFAFDDGKFLLRIKGDANRNDKISFLFDNGSIIEKVIDRSFHLHRAEFTEAVELNHEEVKLFATIFLNKWKVTTGKWNTYFVGGFTNNSYVGQYPTSEEGQYLLLVTIRQLIKQVIFHFPNLNYEKLIE